ncbi:response regulator, partial [Planctomycetota bacterium]
MKKPSKILVIDDEMNICDLFKAFLTRYNFEVDTCLHPDDALAAITANDYDCLLLDFSLPDMSALDFITKVEEIMLTKQCLAENKTIPPFIL